MGRELSRRQSKALGTFVRRYPQAHLYVGLAGNAFFMTGAILFLAGAEPVGTWFFLSGSTGMFLATFGELLRARGKHRLQRTDTDPVAPELRWSNTGSRSSTLD